jgi:hypothetical protein
LSTAKVWQLLITAENYLYNYEEREIFL